MIEDSELLQRYASERSETAFAELVSRHINAVYAGALRRLNGDRHLAEDVTQRVFAALAKDAAKLADRTALASWLHLTTRNIAAGSVRAERRRAAREKEAQTMIESDQTSTADWERLRPVIDGALDELDDRDREAVILRYFQGRSYAEVGSALRLSENAARMRVDRALDRMQGLLSRRGVTSTVGALALVLADQAQVAAPAGLATAVVTTAVAGLKASGAGLAVLSLMQTSKIITTSCALIAAAAVGIAVNQWRENEITQGKLASARHDLAIATSRLEAAEAGAKAMATKAAAAEHDQQVLLAAIDRAETQAVAEVRQPITAQRVQERFDQAQELARSGKPAEALAGFLWCYDEGMVRVASMLGVRNSFLLSAIARLGATYPPALDALRERRDLAEARMQAGPRETDAAREFSALNAALGDNARNMAAYEQLPPNDPRKSGLGVNVFTDLAASRRYAEAVSARPFSIMQAAFDAKTAERPLPSNVTNPGQFREAIRNAVVTSTAKDIEVLAGSGDFDNARSLAEQLLAYDHSAGTRALIQAGLARAGHPNLLTPAIGP